MHSRRPIACFAIVTALAATGGWLCAQESPFVGAKAIEIPAAKSEPAVTETPPAASRPAWVDESLEPSGRTKVSGVIFGTAGTPGTVDVVILESGTYQGLRDGVICRVERDSQQVAEIVIVATNAERSAGLITGLASETAAVKPGDSVRFQKLLLQ